MVGRERGEGGGIPISPRFLFLEGRRSISDFPSPGRRIDRFRFSTRDKGSAQIKTRRRLRKCRENARLPLRRASAAPLTRTRALFYVLYYFSKIYRFSPQVCLSACLPVCLRRFTFMLVEYASVSPSGYLRQQWRGMVRVLLAWE